MENGVSTMDNKENFSNVGLMFVFGSLIRCYPFTMSASSEVCPQHFFF